MSAVLATSLVLLLFAAAAAAAIIAYRVPAVRPAVGIIGATGLLGLSYHYVGAWSRADPSLFPAPFTGEAAASEAGCDRVVGILEENNVLIDRSNPQRIVVNGSLWAQIPEPTRQAVLECFQPEGEAERPIEIIER